MVSYGTRHSTATVRFLLDKARLQRRAVRGAGVEQMEPVVSELTEPHGPSAEPRGPRVGPVARAPCGAGAAGGRWELRAASGLFCSACCCDAALGANSLPGGIPGRAEALAVGVRPGKVRVQDQEDDEV